jgi:predicted P-loop ATPase
VRDGRNNIVAANQHNIRLALVKLGVRVCHDTFADRLLIEGLETNPQRYLGDAEMERLYLLVDERFHFRPQREFFWMVVTDAARRNSFHPVRDYLNGLTWDGKPRLDQWLTTYGQAEDTAYVRAVGRLALVAAVRRVRKPGCKFDEMLVLESAQGMLKSSTLRVLAVREEWFTDDLPLHSDSKEVIERLQGRWIIEAAELRGMRKGEVEHIKAFLSRTTDRARLAYGRLTAEFPRQCVIFGTTNASEYLRDPSGNRRFWPVHVGLFDLEALERDRDQLWAEAAEAEAEEESIRLDPSLYGSATEQQQQRRVIDPWIDVIQSALGDIAEGKMKCEDAWTIVDLRPGFRTQEHNVRMGEAMKALGWVRKKLRFGNKPEWAYVKGADLFGMELPTIHVERDDSGLRVNTTQ